MFSERFNGSSGETSSLSMIVGRTAEGKVDRKNEDDTIPFHRQRLQVQNMSL